MAYHYRTPDIRRAMNNMQRNFAILGLDMLTTVSRPTVLSLAASSRGRRMDQRGRQPRHEETGKPPIHQGDGRFYAPLDEDDVRRVIENSSDERLTNIKIVDIKNFTSFYVSLNFSMESFY